MYREQKVRTGRRRSKNAYTYLNYYIFDNASPEDIEKMRADKSYRPENYCVYSYYTSDDAKKAKLDDLCIRWNDYMSGKSDVMPELFYIDGRVSPKSFYEYDVTEFKNAARNYGFNDKEITSLLIFDSPVSSLWLFLTPVSAVFLVGVIVYLLRKRRRDKGYN